jgi:hypothetical protein
MECAQVQRAKGVREDRDVMSVPLQLEHCHPLGSPSLCTEKVALVLTCVQCQQSKMQVLSRADRQEEKKKGGGGIG